MVSGGWAVAEEIRVWEYALCSRSVRSLIYQRMPRVMTAESNSKRHKFSCFGRNKGCAVTTTDTTRERFSLEH